MKSKVPVNTTDSTYAYKDQEDLLFQVLKHYQWWTEDNEKRATRKDGWNDITDAYWGKLPEDWPFISRTVDPRIRTSLLEKNARLTKNTLKGKVIPREGGDVVRARVNNALIEFQWDSANDGGSMQSKLSICDMDTRLYQSKFAYVYWRTVEGPKGELLFDGNEMLPLNIRDCGMDPNCDHIRNARWFQHRTWESVADLEANKDLYPGLSELKDRISLKQTPIAQKRRDTEYLNRIKQIKGLEDRMGTDPSFPVIEKVVEYRRDKWVIFNPQYNVILAIMDNPYDHKRIPIAQLRYYPIDGDNLGESEVEAVLPLWKAIQAVVCGFLDEVILKMRPPLKIVEGAARIETIVYQPEAQWIMDNINAVQEMESRGDSIRYFQQTYPALVSAFNTAMGDMSQGVSSIDPMSADKTATEVRQMAKQQNTRDQKNQQELAEFIKDIISMWLVNNRQFLFRDENKHEYVFQILGGDNFSYFKRAGMAETETPPGADEAIGGLITELMDLGKEVTDTDIQNMIDSVQIPKYPVVENPKEKDLSKLRMKPKMRMSEMGDSAELSVVPEDLEGLFNYVPDMKSMEASASEQMIMARQMAIQQVTNPNILALLQQEGVRPRVKDLLVDNFEDTGLNDAQKYFETIQSSPNPVAPGQPAATGSVLPNSPDAGMVNLPKAPTQSAIDQQMAGSNVLQ